MKNKILFIGRFPPPVHGASKVNESYLKSKLINKNFELEKVKINKYEEIKDIGKFSFGKFKNIFKVFSKLRKKLKKFNPDLIYFEVAPTGFAFIRDSIYILLCKSFKRKIIFQLHARGIKEKAKNFFWRNYYKFIFNNTKMILLSKIIYEEVKKVIPEKNIYILPNGIENSLNKIDFKKIVSKRNKNKKPVLLFLSNMIEDKGALDVLEICKNLKKKKINFECFFVGAWQERNFKKKFENFIQKNKLEDYCKYLGPKYRKEKEKILSKTDFMIFPTKYKNESFPLVILEAFMFGIPVLSYDTGAIKEIISKDFLGYVSKNKSYEELEKELIKRFKRKKESNKIRKYFEKNYTFKIAEKNLKEIFEEELK